MIKFFKNLITKAPKIGGHRPDPENDQYWSFNKKELFGTTSPTFTGDADLRPFSSPRHNQKSTNSCVAQSVIKALEIKRIQKYGMAQHVDLSVADLYYGCRDKMEPKETNQDNGTNIYLACNVLRTIGVCREVMHPFNTTNIYKAPSILATREAYMNRIKASYRITSTGWDRVDDVIANLQMSNPIAFGTAIGKNWTSNYNSKIAKTNPLGPVTWEETTGRHATCLVGYVDGLFITENSWGEGWGENGYGWLQPELIADDSSTDFWVIISGSETFMEGK